MKLANVSTLAILTSSAAVSAFTTVTATRSSMVSRTVSSCKDCLFAIGPTADV